MVPPTPAEIYRTRRDRFAAECERLDGKIRRLMSARMVTFLAGLICLLAAWDADGTQQWLLAAAGALLLAAFAALVVLHSKTKARRRFQDTLRQVNEDAGGRLRRQWNQLPNVDHGPPPDHAFAADLDLFGHASVFQLLGTAGTIPGREILREWLLHPAPRETVRQRQEAVAELAPSLDYRQNLEAHARSIGREHPQALHAFLEWTRGEDWILGKPALVWAARLLPALTVLSIALDVAGVVAAPIWALTLGIGVFISLKTYAKVHAVFALTAFCMI